MKKRTREDNIFDVTFGIVFIISFVQLPWQTSAIEILSYLLWMTVSIYHITKYLSLNLLQKAIRNKRIIAFIPQFIVCSLAIALMSHLFRYACYLLGQSGYFQPQFFTDTEFTLVYFLNLFFFMGVMTNLCFCAVGFYVGYSNLEKEHMKAQLKILQAQITPHFMFNVLHQINMLMQKDVDTASELLIKYSNILRYQLYSGKEEYVSIGEDIHFLKEFIDIESIRWKNNLDVKCKWEVENNNHKIPPLLLIVFIENAFKHASRTNTEKGYIIIEFKQEGSNIFLTVENTKSLMQIKSKKNTDSGLGLENVIGRLSILYPGKYTIAIDETDSIYLCKLHIML